MSTPAKTKTGGFSIGIRMTGEFDKLPAGDVATWATANGFGCIDVGAARLPHVAAFQKGGLPIGTIDLFGPEWFGMMSADAGKRRATVALAQKMIRDSAAAGVKLFFIVMLAEDVNLPRKATFGYMVETYGALRDVLKETKTKLSVEGWPGCNALLHPRVVSRVPEGDEFAAVWDQLRSVASAAHGHRSAAVRQRVRAAGGARARQGYVHRR